MSSISITTSGFVPSLGAASAGASARPATRLRLTVRGRRLLLGLAAVPIAAAIGFAALSGGAALASSESGQTASDFDTITVLHGDTLWGIASELAPAADPREVIDDIVQLNGLRGASLMEGDVLAIPAQYSK